MLKHITAALAAPPPVRAGSHREGTCEAAVWGRVDKRELRRTVLAAKRYELTTRGKGQREGALGHIAIEILDYMANLADAKTGRLEPSYEHLMRKLKRSKSAIAKALAALRAHGFLSWLRRFRPVHREGPGPRVKQAANAYRISLPRLAARLIGGPMPEPDVERPEKEPTEEVRAFRAIRDGILAGLSCESGERGEGRTKIA